MKLFVADNHYDSRPGFELYSRIRHEYEIGFHEDDFAALEDERTMGDCSLLILNMIGSTCGLEHPGDAAETAVRDYAERGGDFFLLHGGSAAFWQWPWWREMVGVRWVRGNDPDGIEKSTHPIAPYRVEICKVRHALATALVPMSLEEDEIYIDLEQVCPTQTLMQTSIEGVSHPQLTYNRTPWDGTVVNFMPGHRPSTFENPDYLANARAILDYFDALAGT